MQFNAFTNYIVVQLVYLQCIWGRFAGGYDYKQYSYIYIWLDRGLVEKSYNKTHVIFGMLMMRCHSNDESIEATETLSFFKQDSVEMIFIVVEIGSGVYIRMTTPKDILYNKNNNNNKQKEKEKDSFFQAIEFSRRN